MSDVIVRATASVVSYLAARGIDKLIAKWVAQIAFAANIAASKEALSIFRTSFDDIKSKSEGKYKQWEDWRNGLP